MMKHMTTGMLVAAALVATASGVAADRSYPIAIRKILVILKTQNTNLMEHTPSIAA
jgi:hypothetical protein